jgi:hypothetical protein
MTVAISPSDPGGGNVMVTIFADFGQVSEKNWRFEKNYSYQITALK